MHGPQAGDLAGQSAMIGREPGAAPACDLGIVRPLANVQGRAIERLVRAKPRRRSNTSAP